ncbi:alpha/beta hydrolase [Actinoplanes sp. NPDC048791]|uniref:alpha/beta fold hydrolase n=1 Tax=Actinoplanes sp. NPDC048791 TaxID=3154623 RepID=UPI00340B915A
MDLVFVHGSCVDDGAWWWSRVAALLPFPSIAAPLPSCGAAAGQAGLADDVAAVRHVLSGTGPAIVVAHSYGGVVATEAAATQDVRQLVYITSFLPKVGESLATFAGSEPAPFLDFAADGTFGVRRELTEELFLQDCDAAAVEGAQARLTRQSASVVATPVTVAAWQDIPSTYLVCAEDRATPPELQRTQAARARRTVELPTGHHPMLSHPELVAAEIRAAAGVTR